MVALPAAAAPLSDRVRVLRWGIVAADEPRVLSSQSPPHLYRLRDGGASLVLGWAPDQGARSRDQLSVGATGGDQFQHSPP